MRLTRSLTALTGAAVLGIALTACQDQASGTVSGYAGTRLVETLSNPSIGGCHRFTEPISRVENWTQSNLLMFTTPDCKVPPGGASAYVSIQSANEAVPTGLWHSFSFAPE
ncbi:hypothetical protein KUM39_11565 [Streptomyces sp. J2-1]|uniref:hypothetical protein n=1 Tax=Streptomyces corallincola TaxID=2851888 RepID=UPI001C391718|nr:hypothetical protein [Streptomyces corallincola]MBV2354995.1 hypothetical protein [Streptomyces corallincola]